MALRKYLKGFAIPIVLAGLGTGLGVLGAMSRDCDLPKERNRQVIESIVQTNNETYQEREVMSGKVPNNSAFNNVKLTAQSENVINEEYVNQIVLMESGGKVGVKSGKGARGLMQIMPETWRQETKKVYGKPLPFSEAYNPETNMRVGTAYLKTIEQYLSGRIEGWDNSDVNRKRELVAAAYNGGMGRLVKLNGRIEDMPAETKGYVAVLRTNFD